LGRLLAIDYGRKRVGIAVTDPMQIIANKLTTVPTHELMKFLEDYFKQEEVETVVIGYPLQNNGQPSQSIEYINPFIKNFIKKFPEMPIVQHDERFTSNLAFRAMIDAGLKKKARQNKATVDAVSATIILQSYMESKK